MQTLHFPETLPGAAIYASHCTHEPMEDLGTNSYCISGYFGSCHYYFQFSDYHISTNELNDTLGHLTVQIADIPRGSKLPFEGVKYWTKNQCQDTLIGEGGSGVTCSIAHPQPWAFGPATALGGCARPGAATACTAKDGSNNGSAPAFL